MKNNKPNLKFKSGFIRSLSKVLEWIRRTFFVEEERPSLPTCNQLFGPLLLKLDSVIYSRGPKDLINYVKEVRRLYISYLSGNQSTSKAVKTTKDGIPVVLGDLIPEIRRGVDASNIRTTRLLTTILWASRSLKAKSPMDINPIEAPSSAKVDTAFQLGKYTKDF